MQLCRQAQAAMHLFPSVLAVLGCPRVYSTVPMKCEKNLLVHTYKKGDILKINYCLKYIREACVWRYFFRNNFSFFFQTSQQKKTFLMFVSWGQGAEGELWNTSFCGELLGYIPCLESSLEIDQKEKLGSIYLGKESWRGCISFFSQVVWSWSVCAAAGDSHSCDWSIHIAI